MRTFAAALLVCLAAIAQPALACGTRLREVQQRIDAGQLEKLRSLAVEWAAASDLVVIGTVTALERPAHASGALGSVSLAVSETLKGGHLPARVLAWSEADFLLSCDQSQMFNNVGFRDAGDYIVYVKDGRVVRAAAADELRDTSLLSLQEERELVVGRVGE